MKSKVHCGAMLLIVLAGGSAYAAPAATAPAATLESKINDAVKAVETLQAQAQANNVPEQRNDIRQTEGYLSQLKNALAKKDWPNARVDALNASHMVQSPEFQVVWSELLVLLNKQQEMRQASLPETIAGELDKARKTCLEAKTEDQLDGLAQELQALAGQANQMPRSGGVGHSDYMRLENAAQAVHSWQDMLAAKSSGDISGALMRLSNVQNMSQYRLFTASSLEKYKQAMIDAAAAQRDQRIAAFAAAIAKAPNLDACQKVVDAFDKEVRLNSAHNFYDSGVDDMNRAIRAGQTAQVWIDANRAKEAGKPRQALALLSQDWHVMTRPGIVSMSGGVNLDYEVIPQKKWTDLTTELKGMVADESTVIREPALKTEVDALDKADTLDSFLEAAQKNPVDPGRSAGVYSETPEFDNQSVVAELRALIPNVAVLSAMRDDLANSRYRNIIVAWCNVPGGLVGDRTEGGGSYRGSVVAPTVPQYRWKQRVEGFKRQILVQALRGFSQVPDLKLQGNESPDQMLMRVAEAASKAGDYHKTLLTLDAYRVTFYGGDNSPQWLNSDIQGCSEYLAGMNYKAADVPLDAAKSFLEVLGQSGSLAPTKEAGEQIKALREKYPEIVSAAAAQVTPGAAPLPPAAAPALSPPPPAALPPAPATHAPATRP